MIPETVDYLYYGDNLDVLRRYIKDETVGAQARSLRILMTADISVVATVISRTACCSCTASNTGRSESET